MKFSELQIGQKFTHKGIAYTKVQPQKVSCCKTLNAVNDATNEKFMFGPNQAVDVVASEDK
jgi:hypothetical protein